MDASPLSPRYAILLNGPTIEAWQEKVLEHLAALNPAPEPVLLVYRKEMREYSPTSTSWFSRLKKIGWDRLGYYYYQRFFFRSQALAPVQNSPFLKSVPHVTVETTKVGKWSEHFDAVTLQKIREANPDFILRFGFNIIRGEILEIPRYGVWSFHHDDEMKYRGSPPGLWEIYKGDPVTGSVLQRLTDKLDGGIILKKGYFKTIGHSYAKNLDQILFESSRWPAYVCNALANGASFPATPTSTRAPIYKTPNNSQTLWFLTRLLFNNIKNRFENWFVSEKWDLAVVPRPIEEALKPNFLSNIFNLSLSRNDAFYADPFGVETKNGLQILTEKYDYKTGCGSLTSVHFSRGKTKEVPVSGFPAKKHLSYPYLFKQGETTYCIPESLTEKEIALFEAVSFPNQWKRKCALVHNFRGVDATLFEFNGTYWLACTNEDDQPRANLFLFHSSTLEGPYIPHLLNPVKTDIRSARPAGTPFFVNGKLFRPAQDCSRTYGGAIVLNEVLELSPTRFSEYAVKTLGPLPGTAFSAGMHTLSQSGAYTLIDGKVHRFHPASFLRVLKLRFGW